TAADNAQTALMGARAGARTPSAVPPEAPRMGGGNLLTLDPVVSDRIGGEDGRRGARGSETAGAADLQGANQSDASARATVATNDVYAGKSSGTRLTPPLDDLSRGKDVQRGRPSADESQFSAPWIINAARRASDDGAASAAAQPNV